LAVIDQKQRRLVAHKLDDGLALAAPVACDDTKDRRDHAVNRSTIGYRREFDEPHSVGKLVRDLCGSLQRQARLARTACANERDQAILQDERRDFGDLLGPPDEACALRRKIRVALVQRLQRTEPVAQLRVTKLKNLLCLEQVLQAVTAE